MASALSLNDRSTFPHQSIVATSYNETISSIRSPFHKIPSEVLRAIFVLGTWQGASEDGIHSHPIRLSQVCHQWRQVAITTGVLWNDITLVFPSAPSQLALASLYLARSGNYPLDLTMDFRDPDWDWDESSHSFGWKCMIAILDMIVPHVHHWRRVELLTDNWEPISAFLWYTKHVSATPQLETLSLARCNAYFANKGQNFAPASLKRPIPLFGGAVDNLQEISLVGVHLDWEKVNLPNLKVLELKYHADDVLPSLDQFISFLASCPNLNRLTLLGTGPRPCDLIPRTTANSQVVRTRSSHSIQLLNLSQFSFGFVDVEYAVSLLSLFSFPGLKKLALVDVASGLNSADPLDATTIFELLTANDHVLPSRHDCGTVLFPLSSLEFIELDRICVNETVITEFLRECVSLRSLDVRDSSDVIIRVLTPRRSSTHVLCPKLDSLTCKNVDVGTLLGVIRSRTETTGISPLSNILVDVANQDGNSFSDDEYEAFERAGIRFLVRDDTP